MSNMILTQIPAQATLEFYISGVSMQTGAHGKI